MIKFELSIEDIQEIASCIVNLALSAEEAFDYIISVSTESIKAEDV